MEFATQNDLTNIMDVYRRVIEHVNKSSIKLGWNIEQYPNEEFVSNAISNHEMCILKENSKIVALAVVNHHVNDEYDDIDWKIKGPKSKVSTIHALAVIPEKRGAQFSYQLLSDIEAYCRESGDIAIHLDVIDTNVPAYKLYTRNGYDETACIQMYYEVVGTRSFWMMEKVL